MGGKQSKTVQVNNTALSVVRPSSTVDESSLGKDLINALILVLEKLGTNEGKF